MAEAQRLVKEYLDYLEIEKNRSPSTRANYERCLKRFLELTGIVKISDITEGAIRNFRLQLAKPEEELKKKTQAYYVIVIRNFLKYLTKRDYKTVSPDKIELPQIPVRQINIIGYEDLERLLQAPKGNDLKTLRDRAILETLFSTGLRVSELCALDRYIDINKGEVTVRGKGEKLRIVFLSDRAKRAIKTYLDKRTDAEPALFISFSWGKKPKVLGRIIPRTVERLVNQYARSAGIPDQVTPHTLRHGFATDLLMNGADLRSVQELLGHSSITTTQIYTHVTNKELREIHRAFHGRRRE
ncbi:MAG: tyrosine-type recombinase/integrase [Candidatus Colwellbacteria bacterium]|nr:tyrosine-type recombinase/integrase [Candidatus Colwellbacteria bacterium]